MDIQICKLTLNDNLEEVSRLIYFTDKYIYPTLFNNDINYAIKILTEFIKNETIYNYKNIIIAKIDGKIVGLINYLNVFPNNNYEEMLKAYKNASHDIDENFIKVNKDYFEQLKDFKYTHLVCVSVDENYRRKGIAKMMIDYFDKTNLTLAAVKSNIGAIKLYEKCGFRYLYDYPGFLNVPCIEMERIWK